MIVILMKVYRIPSPNDINNDVGLTKIVKKCTVTEWILVSGR